MTGPTYDANVPLRDDDLAESQNDFLINFSTLYDAFARNHVALDAGSLAGNHTVIENSPLLSDPQIGTNEVGVYSKAIPHQTNQLFTSLSTQTSGDTVAPQWTNYTIYSLEQSTGIRTQYFTFLPGPIIVYFGTFFVNFSGFSNVPLSLSPLIATKIIGLSCWPIDSQTATESWAPVVTIPEPVNGIIQSINLRTPSSISVPKNISYIILANCVDTI